GLGGGIPEGRKLKAVIPGGSSTVILTGDEIDVGYDFDSLAKLGTAMGSAGIVAIDERVCMVQLGIRISEFYEHESCGKCTPCRGAAVGACRMCLVEVEGMPKLQAGCTMTAQDGLVVCTAATSQKAAEGQNATLEFILVNHPLDCPVCDKGGECPLQDLTFRYGPGSTRMRFDKLTLEKPIPISPTISLDRERCILCYRCTRFSEAV